MMQQSQKCSPLLTCDNTLNEGYSVAVALDSLLQMKFYSLHFSTTVVSLWRSV